MTWHQRELTLEDTMLLARADEMIELLGLLSSALAQRGLPELNVLAHVTKRVSEQRAAEKGFRVMNSRAPAFSNAEGDSATWADAGPA